MDAQRRRRLHGPTTARTPIDSRTNVKTFEWLQKELVGKGLTGSVPPGELDRADAFKAFTDGKVGMLNGHPTLMQEAREGRRSRHGAAARHQRQVQGHDGCRRLDHGVQAARPP